jgi:cytochrome c
MTGTWLHFAGVVLSLGSAGCGGQSGSLPSTLAGDSERGRLLLWQYGCGTCHQIPGVVSAEGNVGPPLVNVGKQVYLAGVLPNTPENLIRWIRAPQDVDPLTAMPDLKVPEAQALDMAAYLYTLK